MCTHRGDTAGITAGVAEGVLSHARESIAADTSADGIEKRMRILLGGSDHDLSRETEERLLLARSVARTWGEAAKAVTSAPFTDASFGAWEFDADTASRTTTGVGAQILTERDPRGEVSYSMRTWTWDRQGDTRYFHTRAAAMKAARAEMMKRLHDWAHSQHLGTPPRD